MVSHHIDAPKINVFYTQEVFLSNQVKAIDLNHFSSGDKRV